MRGATIAQLTGQRPMTIPDGPPPKQKAIDMKQLEEGYDPRCKVCGYVWPLCDFERTGQHFNKAPGDTRYYRPHAYPAQLVMSNEFRQAVDDHAREMGLEHLKEEARKKMYKYEEHRVWVMSDDGQLIVMRAFDSVRDKLAETGVIAERPLMSLIKGTGDSFLQLAVVDRLLELGVIRQLACSEMRVFVKGSGP